MYNNSIYTVPNIVEGSYKKRRGNVPSEGVLATRNMTHATVRYWFTYHVELKIYTRSSC
jgi:hypothetical protein